LLLAYHWERYVQSHKSFVPVSATPAWGGIAVGNTTILVVDDEPQIRRVLQATLSRNGNDVILAKDGQEAIEMVIREHPDLILLDVNMPGMSGLEACSKIQLSFTDPIIMVTVRNSEQDKIHSLDSGADDYARPRFILTEPWLGYRFQLPIVASEKPLRRKQ
jgi:two-component system, OmpR family, response regulator VicR